MALFKQVILNTSKWDSFLKAFENEELNDSFDSLFEEDEINNSLPNENKSDTSDSSVTKPKRKLSQEERDRRNQRRRVNVFPRVLKRDPRRNYPQMFVNVFNLANENMIKSYLEHYYSPFVKMQKKFSDDTPSYAYQKRGHFLISRFIEFCYTSMPDVLMKLYDSQVVINPKTNCSVVILKARFTGTVVTWHSQEDYHRVIQNSLFSQHDSFANFAVANFQNEIVILGEEGILDSSLNFFEDSNYPETIDSSPDPRTFLTYQLPKPTKGRFDSYISLFLDENFCIQKFEMFVPPKCMILELNES